MAKKRRSKQNKKEDKQTNWGDFVTTLLVGPIISITVAYLTINSFINSAIFPTSFKQYPFDKRAKSIPTIDPIEFATGLFDNIINPGPKRPTAMAMDPNDKSTMKIFQMSNKPEDQYGYFDHVKDFASLVLNQSTMNKYKIQNEINDAFRDITPDINADDFQNRAMLSGLYILSPIFFALSILMQTIISGANTTIVSIMKYMQGLVKGYFILDIIFAALYFVVYLVYLLPITGIMNLYELYGKTASNAIWKNKIFLSLSIATVCFWGAIASSSSLVGTERTVGLIVSVLAFPLLSSIIYFK